MYKQIWTTLSAIDCSNHIEKKNNLSYLSWAWAWGVLMDYYPEASYSFDDPQTFPDGTVMVFCTVSIQECSRKMWLPVMDHRNKAIANPDSFAVNTAMMRCLVKCLALYGLGHYIYAGEDLPPAEQARQEAYITPEQALEVSKLLTETDSDVIAFCKHFKIDCVDELKSKDFERAMFALNKKLEAK
jgi:hypothetical protein